MDFDLDSIRDMLRDDKSRTYLIIGVTVVVGALYLILAFAPAVTSFLGSGRTARELEDSVEVVKNQAANMDKLKAQLDDLRAEDKGFAKSFPKSKEMSALLEEFANMARKSDVTILSITPQEVRKPAPARPQTKRSRRRTAKKKPAPKGYFEEVPIIITARSGYHQLGHFVQILEQGDRFITIRDIQINADRRDPWMHDVKILMTTYVSVDDEK